jgi:hypothetical protein
VIRLAIKGGDLIHTGNLVLIDRAQTAGPGQVNINSTKIYELGNYYSLATVYDTPDLTFSLDSFDASAEFEALLLNKKFSKANGTQTATVGGSPTGGNFTLTYGGQTTGNIAYNASATDVQTALEALSTLAPGDVSVSGDVGGPYTVTFSSAFLAANTVTAMTSSATGLTPAGTVTVATFDGVQMAEGTALNPAASIPMDVVSAFKPGLTAAAPYDVIGSVAIPYIQLETLSYRFGISDSASQNATLRGDSIFYTPSSTYVELFTGTATAGQTLAMTHPAVVYHGDKVNQTVVDGATTKATRYALSVALASGKRLLPGADYTESVTAGVLSVVINAAVPTTDQVRVIYASTDVAVYPQAAHAPVAPTRPAAIRGRDVEVFIGGTNLADRWTSVQQVTVDWRVTLEKDEELGNAQAVSQTFDVPEVSGTVDLKPRDYQELYRKVCITAGVTPGEVAGAITTVPLPLVVKLHSPDDGSVLKTLYVPDARFTLPGYSGQAGQGQKLTVTFNWSSDSGALIVYKGEKLT